MVLIPPLTKDDCLRYIIYPAQFYYNCYLVKWMGYFSMTLAAMYLSTLVCNAWLYGVSNITEQYVYYAILFLLMMANKVTLDLEKDFMEELSVFKIQYFWPNEFVTLKNKRSVITSIRVFNLLHVVLAGFGIASVIVLNETPNSYPTFFLYNDLFPLFFRKVLYKIGAYILLVFGFYAGIAHECQYAYHILHNHFQMKLLVEYMKQRIKPYRNMSLKYKIQSKKYQLVVNNIFIQSIKHYIILRKYGAKISYIYSNVAPWYFMTSILTLSAELHALMFNIHNNNAAVITTHLIFFWIAVLFYIFIGGLYSDTFDNFYDELLQWDWHALNVENLKLYYTFLMYTQKGFSIQILTSTNVTRSLLTNFMKTIYTVITLFRTIAV